MLWPRLSPERFCVCCRSSLSARSAPSATRVALQSRSRSLSLSERTKKPPFGGLFLLRNGHRPVRNPASPVFSPAPGSIRTARNGLSAVGRYSASTPAVSFAPEAGVRGRLREWVLSDALLSFRYADGDLRGLRREWPRRRLSRLARFGEHSDSGQHHLGFVDLEARPPESLLDEGRRQAHRAWIVEDAPQ